MLLSLRGTDSLLSPGLVRRRKPEICTDASHLKIISLIQRPIRQTSHLRDTTRRLADPNRVPAEVVGRLFNQQAKGAVKPKLVRGLPPYVTFPHYLFCWLLYASFVSSEFTGEGQSKKVGCSRRRR